MTATTQETDMSDLLILDSSNESENELVDLDNELVDLDNELVDLDNELVLDDSNEMILEEAATFESDLTSEPEELTLGGTDSLLIEDSNEIMVAESDNLFSLEEATSNYVGQLESRKTQIADDISDDEQVISTKENQIKDLRSDINDYKKFIKELNEETTAIDTNIGLVSGKVKTQNIKTAISAKVHNIKRKKAA